jgi:hypothetical protein
LQATVKIILPFTSVMLINNCKLKFLNLESLMKRAVVATLGVAIVVAGAAIVGPYAADQYARSTVEKLFERARTHGAKVATYKDIKTNFWQREVILSGVVLESAGGGDVKLTLDSLNVNLPWVSSGTVSARSVSAKNVVITAAEYVNTLPELHATGFVLRSTQPADGGPVKSFLRSIDASSVNAPTAKLKEKDIAERTATGLTVENIDHGKAQSMVFTSLEGTAKIDSSQILAIKAGEGSYTDIDFAALAAVYGDQGTADAPLEQLVATSVIENLEWSSLSKQGVFKISRISMADLKGRPLQMRLSDFPALAQRLEKENSTPEDSQALSTALTDMTSAFSIGNFSIEGLEGTTGDTTIKMAKFTAENMAKAKLGLLSADGIDVSSKDGTFMKIATSQLKEFNFGPSLALLQAQADEAAGKPVKPVVSMAIYAPVFSGIEITNLQSKLSDTPYEFKLLNIETSDHANGIPLKASFKLAGLQLNNAISGNDFFGIDEILKDSGIDKIVADYGFSYAFDEASKKINISDVSMNMQALAGIQLTGGFAGVEKQLFYGEVDTNFMELAANVEVEPAQLRLKDAGLTNKLFASFSKSMDVPEEILRGIVKEQVSEFNEVLFKNALNDESVAAINRFIDVPKSLTIRFEPKQKLKAMEAYIAYQFSPESLLSLLNVTVATAE